MGLKSVRFGSALTALVLSAGLVWVGACDSDDGTEPPTEETATIQVTVTVDGSAQQGVTVRLFEASATNALATTQTGSNGVATFADLAAGVYEVDVAVPSGLELADGASARQNVTVAAGATASVAVSLVSDVDPGVVEIHLTSGDRFDPSSVTISPGTTVRWINDIARFHTITPDGHSEWSRQEMTDAGQVFTHTFNNTGTFDYFCEPHESVGMVGTIIVE